MTIQEIIGAKILTGDALSRQLAIWRFKDLQIVFTNGCFDLIHYGHLAYLMDARACGHKLIVGLNSDASVSRLKGPNRPIKDQSSRLWLLASMAFVDAVTVFDQDTPLELIREVMPDILVKGGDYAPDQIVGAEEVIANGGQVKVLPFVDGYSTTSLEQKILSRPES